MHATHPLLTVLQIGHVAEALHAFNKGFALDKPGRPSIGPMRILAHMYQCTGEHTKAVDMLTRALQSPQAGSGPAQGDETPRVDCLFLRGKHWQICFEVCEVIV